VSIDLRDYQIRCKEAVVSDLSANGSTLAVMPTGCGKTETFLSIADEWPEGKVLVLAHRDELVWQPFNRWKNRTSQYAEVIQQEYRRTRGAAGGKLICASKDTLYREERLKAEFPDPSEVGLIIIDEAHHAVRQNKTYQRILDYFPKAKRLGVTATPDRTDEAALGQTFESVAFEFPLLDPGGGSSAIGDGWLVPIEQEIVTIEGLDFSGVGTRGGDFIGGQLEREMMREKPLHGLTRATFEEAGERQVIVFASGVWHATRAAEILNRYREGSAAAVVSRVDDDADASYVIDSGDKDQRKRLLRRFSSGDVQYLVNCGVFTEGFDEPRVGLISMGRPTKSRSLYAQMAGRGTRILPGVIEGDGWRLETPEKRRAAIAASGKTCVRILDFVGNSRHALVTSIDILGGSYPDAIVEKAKEKARKATAGGKAVSVAELLAETQEEVAAEAEARRRLVAEAKYSRRKVDPFQAIGAVVGREPGWFKGKPPSQRMKDALVRFKVPAHEVERMSFTEARVMMDKLVSRSKQGLCSFKQARILSEHGYSPNVTFEQASGIIDSLARNGWKRPELNGGDLSAAAGSKITVHSDYPSGKAAKPKPATPQLYRDEDFALAGANDF
jgi:superfamily II DNA or RNA helicase